MSQRLSVAIVLLALAAPVTSRADDGSDRAAAEVLFAEGRRLMASGDYLHACPMFAASQKLDPAMGTSLVLAGCYEKVGAAPAPVVAQPSALTPPVSIPREPPINGSARSGTGQRVLGATLGGLAVVAAGAGAILGLTARARWSDARKVCASFPYECAPEAVSEGQDAESAANIATMAFVIAGVALTGGAIVYFTAPRGAPESGLALHLAPNGAMLSGRFQ